MKKFKLTIEQIQEFLDSGEDIVTLFDEETLKICIEREEYVEDETWYWIQVYLSHCLLSDPDDSSLFGDMFRVKFNEDNPADAVEIFNKFDGLCNEMVGYVDKAIKLAKSMGKQDAEKAIGSGFEYKEEYECFKSGGFSECWEKIEKEVFIEDFEESYGWGTLEGIVGYLEGIYNKQFKKTDKEFKGLEKMPREIMLEKIIEGIKNSPLAKKQKTKKQNKNQHQTRIKNNKDLSRLKNQECSAISS